MGSKMAGDYFRLLDIDGDNYLSFAEFLAPMMDQIPPRVAIVFVSDIRFKLEVFHNLRSAFKTVSKISELVTKDLIKGKLSERKDSLSEHFVVALDALVFDTEELNHKQFMREVARMEKHCLNSFANLLFR